MKVAVTLVLALAAGAAAFGSAQAKLTPFDGAREAKVAAQAPLASNATASSSERSYFTAPQVEAAQSPGRCTVQTFVFAKTRLAEACY